MTFGEWLEENDYVIDKSCIQYELSSEECDVLYEKYSQEGYA